MELDQVVGAGPNDLLQPPPFSFIGNPDSKQPWWKHVPSEAAEKLKSLLDIRMGTSS